MKKSLKRIISLLLAINMALSYVPVLAHGLELEVVEGTETAETDEVESGEGTVSEEEEVYSILVPIDSNINFVGMSIWWYDGRTLVENGVGGGVTARGYQTLLKECFTFKSSRNYCYSGYSLSGTNADDSRSIINAVSSWTGETGDIWTLDTITNDFKRDIPIGTIEDYINNTGITTYYGALRAFSNKVFELSGKEAVVICSNALRRNNDGYTSTSANTQGHTLADYEIALKEIAELNGWYFVDQFNQSGITDELLATVTLDGLHLNNAGYEMAVKPW
ncbi:MAG: hypothetical protein IJ306_10700, partial [Oscillospiraceae bacterium]|nr:hypothetical protein [Oscillospiraceae bacterium]